MTCRQVFIPEVASTNMAAGLSDFPAEPTSYKMTVKKEKKSSNKRFVHFSWS